MVQKLRDIVHAELRMLGHEVIDHSDNVVVVDGTTLVCITPTSTGFAFWYAGFTYQTTLGSINWPLFLSALSAVANKARRKQVSK